MGASPRLFVAAAVAATAIGANAQPAAADIFRLFGEAHGGGMDGQGTAGDQKDSAFFANAPHLTYGGLVGAELFIFDALIQHHQYTNGSRLTTWTQFGLGLHFNIELGSEQEQKEKKGNYFELGVNAFFGIGTGQQVMPPLDNAQLSDKGFLAEARVGYGKHLSSMFDFGIVVPASYGYFFKSGNGAAVNNLSTHYRGWEIEGLLALRANLRLL